MDLEKHLHAIRRSVTDAEQDGTPVRVVVAARTYPSPPEDVWDAITDAERIARWFTPVSGDLRLGGRYQLEGNAGGTVTACEPPRHLSLTWEYGPEVSWVQVDLAAAGAGTELRLRHAAPVDPERWGQFGPGAVGIGWELGLLGLDLHLSAPDGAMDRAWAESDEARVFMAGSSTGWEQASVAAGEDPEAARAAAERTTAFYTGTG